MEMRLVRFIGSGTVAWVEQGAAYGLIQEKRVEYA